MARHFLRGLFNDEPARSLARHDIGPTVFMSAPNREKHVWERSPSDLEIRLRWPVELLRQLLRQSEYLSKVP